MVIIFYVIAQIPVIQFFSFAATSRQIYEHKQKENTQQKYIPIEPDTLEENLEEIDITGKLTEKCHACPA